MKKSSRAPDTDNAELPLDYTVLNRIVDRAFYYALQMIHIANHREVKEKGEPKVGGHPSACASSQHILAAIHLVLRQPEDYFACKPHVSPIDHAFNYLLHNFRDKDGRWMTADERRLAMQHLRHYSTTGEPVFQSYHAEADPDSYRYFPSGSVGIPPVTALYTSLGYDFARDHGMAVDEDPTFWCLMGDSEFREGSLMEAMPDAGERQLGNLVWIVDYNRQNLDGTRVFNEKALRGTDADRIVRIAEANGWEAIQLKHGKKRERLFAQPGGEEFKRVLDEAFTDFEFQAVLEANRPDLTREVLLKKSAKLKEFLKKTSDKELQEAFVNLAGHDLESLVEALSHARDNRERPTLLVPYTIKGYRLKCQAQSGNHSAMPEEDELRDIAKAVGTDLDTLFEEFASGSPEAKFLEARRKFLIPGIERISQAVEERRESHHEEARKIPFPVDFEVGALKFNPVAHTQWMWGQIAAKIDRLARGLSDESGGKKTGPSENDKQWGKVARYFLTMAPDVGSSTNTSPNMNGKLYGDIGQEDFEKKYGTKDKGAPDVIPKPSQRSGHLRFEIAEGNCMSAAGAFGKFNYFVGIPFYPGMTIYDFFIKRAHDQFYYNLYWGSHFATIGTPSGITLAPEGAQHSWKSDFQIPHCVTWEPCFARELEWVLADILRRHFTGEDTDREAALIRCVTKGLVQKEFLDRLKRQARFKAQTGELTVEEEAQVASKPDEEIFEQVRLMTLEGGYPLVDYRGYRDYTPGDNVVHLFAMGALVPEALKASDALREKGIFANVFVVTSSDLLLGNFAENNQYEHLRKTLGISGDLYLRSEDSRSLGNAADWYAVQGGRVPVVSVHDGEPGLLDNIGSVVGVKQKALAVRKTSKSGTTWDIFHMHHLDAEAISAAAEEILTSTANERFRLNSDLWEIIDRGNGRGFENDHEHEHDLTN